MIHPRVLVVLAFLLLVALPAGAGDDEIDIRKVSPEDLGGGDVTQVLAEATRAYRATEYEKSAQLYIRVLRLTPGDSTALYNLACCYGLLTLPDQAARFLEASWNAGFRDIGHIGYDSDFTTVRETPVFTALLLKLKADAEKREKEGGRRLPVECRVMGDVRVIEPEGMVPGRRYPLVVGLHGYGSNGESFARLFSAKGVKAPFLYCVPQAPYPFPSGNTLAMSWGFGGPGIPRAAGLLSERLSEEYVLAAIRAVKREYLVDERRVFVLGFSQGAGMAFRMGMRYPTEFAGAIPIGGWCVPGEYPAGVVRKAAQHGNFLICHSPGDRSVTYDSCERAKAFFEESGITHRVIDYEGGHSVPVDLQKRIAAFIAKPIAAREETEQVLLRYRFPADRALRYYTRTGITTRVGDVVISQTQEDAATWLNCGETDGAHRVAITYHLKEISSRDGRRLAVIEVTSILTPTGEEKRELTGARISGEVRFDVERGVIER